jgi:hypothetical protein
LVIVSKVLVVDDEIRREMAFRRNIGILAGLFSAIGLGASPLYQGELRSLGSKLKRMGTRRPQVAKPTMVKPPIWKRPWLCAMEMPTEDPNRTRTQRYRNHLKSSGGRCLRCGLGLR